MGSVAKLKFKEAKQPALFKLDLGAGKGANTPEDFTAVDLHKSPDVQQVDLRKRWPWKDESIDEVRCIYLVQYLTAQERVHFFNELHRVLKPGATATFHTPHWCAAKAYTDIRIQWPPVSESFYFTLSKAWREAQNEQDTFGFTCNFEAVIGYGMHPAVSQRHTERAQEQMQWDKEAVQELVVNLTKI